MIKKLLDIPEEKAINLLVQVESACNNDIAIIGMAVKLPSAENIDQFWDNLCAGRDHISEFPEKRRSDVEQYLKFCGAAESPGFIQGGYLEEIDKFDYSFFRITPKEASLMDPYQRLFLETAWTAIENSGYGGERLTGSRTGVYVGSGGEHEYRQMIEKADPDSFVPSVAGNLSPVTASRISYMLDLKGPSLMVDTACSSSLVAVHLACQSIMNNDCEMAIAGGIQLDLFPLQDQPKVGIESPTFKVKAFDDRADGTVKGEGVGAVVLKPLAKALQDGDHIYATIKGSSANQDGKSIGITSPNVIAQESLILNAWKQARVEPESITYIETHGTGTKIGDPIEVDGIQRAFSRYTDKKQFCAIGSVKTNIGHLYYAAGIISVIKAALSLHNKKIPGTLHFEKPNKNINFIDSPVYPNTGLADWNPAGFSRRCGVSSFGMSGTNCHVVLEEAPLRKDSPIKVDQRPAALTLSAQNPLSLEKIIGDYINYLAGADAAEFRDICYTSNIGRGHYSYRLAIIAENLEDLITKLNRVSLSPDYFETGKGGIYSHSSLANSGAWEQSGSGMPEPGSEFLHSLCSSYANGEGTDWTVVYTGERRRIVPLPTYPFERKRCWIRLPDTRQKHHEEPAMALNFNRKEALSNMYHNENKRHVINSLKNIFSEVSGLEPDDINIHTNLLEMGLDSILLTSSRHAIKEQFDIDVPMRMFFEQLSSIDSIGDYLVSLIPLDAGPEPSGYQEAAAAVGIQEQAAAIQMPLMDRQASQREESSCKSPANLSAVESVMEKQLQVMSQQLELLHALGTREEEPSTLGQAGRLKAVQPLQAGTRSKGHSPDPEAANETKRAFVPYQHIPLKASTNFSAMQQQFLDSFISAYTHKTAGSQKHTDDYRYVLANNRNVAGFRPYWKDIVYQIVVDHSSGSRIWDIDGNEYVDLTMGFGVNLFGHNVPFINDEIQREVERGMAVGPISQTAGEVAALICKFTGTDRTAFFNSGTEAVMVALRLARAATGRSKVVLFSGSYHGTFDGVLAMGGSVKAGAQPIAPGINHNMVEDIIVLNYGTGEALEIIEAHANELAAVLVEPVQSRRPDLQPVEFLKKIREITSMSGTALIFDEVITGFRMHPGGAQALFDIKADLATYGKVIGGGLPIGVVAGTDRFMNGIDGGAWKFHDDSQPAHEERRTFVAGTFCQHPLAMNAALAVLTHLERMGPELQANLNFRTARLAGELNTYFREQNVPVDVVHFGSLFRFVLRGDLELFYYLLLNKGLYIWEGRNCFISTAHTDEDIQYIVDAVKQSIGEMQAAGFLPGPDNRPRGGYQPKPLPSGPARESLTRAPQVLKLTEEQQQISLVIHSNDTHGVVHHETVGLYLRGELNKAALETAYHKVLNRHESLRSTISADGNEQIVASHANADIFFADILADYSALGDEAINQALLKENAAAFDSVMGPLIRLRVLATARHEYLLALSAHHIIADGWSLIVFLQELAALYSTECTGTRSLLPTPTPFSDYAIWQKRMLESQPKEKAAAYWKNKFSVQTPAFELPSFRIRDAAGVRKGSRHRYVLDIPLTAKLKAVSQSMKVSLFTVLLSAYKVLLYRISNHKELVVGIPTAGQMQMGQKHLVGYCLNILPFSTTINPEMTFREYLSYMMEELLELYEYQDYSYASLMKELHSLDGSVHPPQINTMFNMDKSLETPDFTGMDVELLQSPVSYSKYDLSMNIVELDHELMIDFEYDPNLFDTQIITGWANYFNRILLAVLQPDRKLQEISLLSLEEEKILRTRGTEQAAALRAELDKYGVSWDEADIFVILDKDMHPSPVGVPGEVYLARLTEPSLLAEQPSTSTGIMAMYTADFEIKVIGHHSRLMSQNGRMINLDTIQEQLVLHPLIGHAAVTVKPSGTFQRDQKILAYITPRGTSIPKVREIKKFLLSRIPGNFIPSAFMVLDEIPLNSKGGINERLLPAFDEDKALREEIMLPENETEERLAEIWRNVLNLELVNTNDDFFELGGNSLKASLLAFSIQKEFSTDISLRMLFEHPTVKGLAKAINGAGKSFLPEITPLGKKDWYPQSSSQKRLFAIEQMGGAGTAYNITGILHVEGKLDPGRMEEAFQRLVKRHEPLRTSFELLHDEPVQVIHDDIPFSISYSIAEDEDEPELVKRFILPFSLNQAPLFRVHIVSRSDHEHIVIMDMHHIIADGISANILCNDLISLYSGENLPGLEVQYKDYTALHNEMLSNERIRQQGEYWQQLLSDDIPSLTLPLDFPRPPVQSFDGACYSVTLDSDLTRGLKVLSNRLKTTLYTLLLASYNILLSKYSNQEDIVIGSPVAGRFNYSTNNMVGMFVNTLAMRNQPAKHKTFQEFLLEVKENTLEAFENQDYPFEELISKLGIERDISRNPVFDVMFVLQSLDLAVPDVHLDDIRLNGYEFKNDVAKFDLILEVIENTENLTLNFEYCAKLFQESTIIRMSERFLRILTTVVENCNVLLSDIDLLPKEETDRLIYTFNDTATAYPGGKTVYQLFEEQAARTPGAVALVHQGESITYEHFNRKTNQMARMLRSKGVKPDTTVGILMEHSFELIISMFAVMKAGGAYVPIDPTYPSERINFIIKDSNLEIMLTHKGLAEKCQFQGEFIDAASSKWYCGDDSNPVSVNSPDDLAYIIYTSGSTGLPKGVMTRHQGLTNYVWWGDKTYVHGEAVDFPLYSSIAFDLSVTLIYIPLISGNKVFIYSGVSYESLLEAVVIDNQVDFIMLTPSHLKILGEYDLSRLKIRKFIIGGEAFDPFYAKKFFSRLAEDVEVYNVYGPTETTVACTFYRYYPDKDLRNPVPIGGPIFNVQLYVVDQNGKLQGIGIPGELCIAGDGVSRGYLNREELTREKFVPDPFQTSGMMYRTGDLVRMLQDGNVEFLGRMDDQVKIRGHRIELGEIENQLVKQPGVNKAAVIISTGPTDSRYLCAYYTADFPMNSELLRESLSRLLPRHMVPSFFVQMKSIPLTASGKVDRKKLPDSFESFQMEDAYSAPQNFIEEKLALVWEEVLGINKVGTSNSFIKLGGDSIKAIQIVSRLKKYGLSLEVKELFLHQNIKGISPFVKQNIKRHNQGTIEGPVKLTAIQKWFFEQNFAEMHHWNQSILLHNERFDVQFIRQAFQRITEHHDALRMVYRHTGQAGVEQSNRGLAGELFSLEVTDLTGCDDHTDLMHAGIKTIQKGIDLEKGPLLKLGLYQTTNGDYLAIVIHHLVVDGVSWRIILDDFASCYLSLDNGEEAGLIEKSDSYQKWAEALEVYANSPKLLQELAYWTDVNRIAVPALPKDSEAGNGKIKDRYQTKTVLSEKETTNLLRHAGDAYQTETLDLLLAALGAAIKGWANVDRVRINMEGHGREALIQDLDITRTVGWFTSTYPLVLELANSHELPLHIMTTKETIRQTPNKGMGYQVLKYLTSPELRAAVDFNVMPEISFNYLGQFGNEASYGTFEICNTFMESTESPESHRPYAIDINAMIVGNRVEIRVDYNPGQFNEATMSRFAELLLNSLKLIISHCTREERIQRSPSDLTYKKLTFEELDDLNRLYPGGITDVYTMTPMQESMLFHALKNKRSDAYHEQCILDLKGDIIQELLNESFKLIVGKYDILRTRFVYKKLHRPLQIVLGSSDFHLEFEDITHMESSEKMAHMERLKALDREKRFDLVQGPLMRAILLKTGDSVYQMLWSFHHILMDGWCIGIVLKDMLEHYKQLNAGSRPSLETHQYRLYLDWLASKNKEEAKVYWMQYLEDYKYKELLRKEGTSKEFRLAVLDIKLEEKVRTAVTHVASSSGITINSFFQAVWGILLSKYDNAEDVVFGAVISGRSPEIEGIERMVGLFINTIPVRVRLSGKTFHELAGEIQSSFISSEQYGYVPLSDIQAWSHRDLINHVMVFENYPLDREIRDTDGQQMEYGFQIAGCEILEHTNYDFSIIIEPGEDFIIRIVYNALAYDKETISILESYLLAIIGQVTACPQIEAGDVEVLSQEEKLKLMNVFNKPNRREAADFNF
ncbi:non-ribosomal peptide synthetase [Paenibacillus riograndensis]|uniref:Uncharacterized protein n=1 Tax=Paenibacillus riograndensis SBR5 TaxID=1073571 RepID=A0A0E4CZ46_9BACL|nr:non-ribosomal peptide synthetase [Paenibacillus riograndensis]CQR58132.1 hypothetical protein PRIO_5745 [Paenibacillus riograndensis SBR5]